MSQEEGIRFCEKLFAARLDGHPLLSNATHLRGSAIWIQFPRIVCGSWVHRIDVDGQAVPLVLMGDAAHTAHYSIGSGTKLALEDAIELARCCASMAPRAWARCLPSTRTSRSVEVLKIQSAARNSMEWFENVDRYTALRGRAVRLFDADAEPAHSAREPPLARRRRMSRAMRTGWPRTLSRRPACRCRPRRARFRRC